jgi:predicted ATPase
MNATVAWSYELLAPGEQRAFRRLGAVPGRFPMEAAAAVLAGLEDSSAGGDEALGAVAALIDKSLLLRVETSVATRPLYEMLETVRAYAAVQLTAVGEEEDALEGLARYSAREASLALAGLAGPAQVEWLGRVRDDLESHRGALAWLIQRDRSVEAAHIACGLMAFWLMSGHFAEGLQWYEQTLGLPSLSPAAESRTLVGAALMLYTQGELARAGAGLTRALAVAHGAGDAETSVMAENLLGHIETAAGNLDSARGRFTRTLEAFRTLAVPWGIGNALSGLALASLVAGDVVQAERLLLEATAVLQQAGPWFLAPVTNIRAMLAAGRGDSDEAIALVRENLIRIRELQDKFAFVYALVPLAAAAVLKGDDAWAAQILGAGDVVTERTGATIADRPVQEIRAHTERGVRGRLGPDRWAREYQAGRSASMDSLMKDIDSAAE